MDTRRRLVLITGLVLVLAGCISSLYLFSMILNAQIYGLFLGIVTESPTQEFRDLRCPLVVSRNETIPIAVSIFNPTTQDLDYRIWIEPHGFVVGSPGEKLRITAPGGADDRNNVVCHSRRAGQPGDCGGGPLGA